MADPDDWGDASQGLAGHHLDALLDRGREGTGRAGPRRYLKLYADAGIFVQELAEGMLSCGIDEFSAQLPLQPTNFNISHLDGSQFMTSRRLRVGINGFGRIGRTVARLVLRDPDLQLVAINDLIEDLHNLVYLYNYDSTYGRAPQRAYVTHKGERCFHVGDDRVVVFRSVSVTDAAWDENGVDVLVEATGVLDNVRHAHDLVATQRIRKVIVTHTPAQYIDQTLVYGLNEDAYDPARHHVISSSICDTNAIAHPLSWLDDAYGIQSGFVTTLHPWLSYQNLLDAGVGMQSHPGHYWKDYSLGRASTSTLIPKETTAVRALGYVLPDLATRLGAFSYRTPTAIVSTADMTLRLERPPTLADLRAHLIERSEQSPVIHTNEESLVGTDYIAQEDFVIDLQWLKIVDDLVKLVVWYDNEWGYSARVVDLVRLLGNT